MRRSPCRSPIACTSVGGGTPVAAREISCIIRDKIRHGVSHGCEQDRAGMINRQPSTRSEIYGHRARIGYTCPPRSAEVFFYEFYNSFPPA
jgi:hypothetical protein